MIEVNAMGEACPIPVVKTLHALQELDGAGTVQTLVDNGTYDEIYAKYFLAAEETEGAEETAETEEAAG